MAALAGRVCSCISNLSNLRERKTSFKEISKTWIEVSFFRLNFEGNTKVNANQSKTKTAIIVSVLTNNNNNLISVVSQKKEEANLPV